MSSKQSYYLSSNSYSTKKEWICVVCGSIPRGYNFGAITCMSCKMFFRRNALTGINKWSCSQKGNCQMSPQTRRYCSYCRLRTCFRMGMRKDFIRNKKECSKSTINTEQSIQMMYPNFIRPLDLLRWSDRSHLSNNDWLLLHHLSSIFDSLTDHVISTAHQMYHELTSIGIQPLKMRVKASYIYDIANTFADVVLKFVKSGPQFVLLPSINQQASLMRNTRPMIMFHSFYQLNLKPVQNLTQTPYWISAMECLFSPSTKHMYDQIHYLVGNVAFIDPCLIKLILVILAFSTNNIDHDETTISHQLDEYYHAFVLHKVQNMYLELMWKYMIYRFGEQRAIYLFTDIIRTILRVQIIVSVMDNSNASSEQKFDETIAKITDRTLRLNLRNEL